MGIGDRSKTFYATGEITLRSTLNKPGNDSIDAIGGFNSRSFRRAGDWTRPSVGRQTTPTRTGMSTTVTRPVTTTSGGAPTAAETALAYVREVRNRFERQPRTYEEFLNVMKDFKSGVCVPHLELAREPTRRDARNE
jgi:hypothetical protein